MENNKARIALISPSNNAYSETFIKAHKEKLDFKVFHYYGNNTYFPIFLDSGGALKKSFNKQITHLLQAGLKKVRNKPSNKEAFYTSAQKESLVRSFKKNKIEVVLAEYGPTGALCTAVCKENNIPLIVHFHGLDASIHSVIEKYKNLYLDMFEYAAKIIVVSNKMYNRLIELGAPKHKLIINIYGPNDLFFDITNTFSSRQFLSVGRFVDKKAPYLTIMSFKKALVKYPDATLNFIGDGPLLNTCINIVKSEKIENSVRFSGVQGPEEIQQAMSVSYAYVQHSVTALNGDMEGTPVGILEASAAGLPVISTRHAGIPDVIIEGTTGLLVDELDTDGMANAMMSILSDPQKASSMGAAGRKNIHENFSMQKHIGKLNSIIYDALKK